MPRLCLTLCEQPTRLAVVITEARGNATADVAAKAACNFPSVMISTGSGWTEE